MVTPAQFFFSDGALIGLIVLPANTITDVEGSGLVSGHVASRVRSRMIVQPVQRVGQFIGKFEFKVYLLRAFDGGGCALRGVPHRPSARCLSQFVSRACHISLC